MLHLVRAEHGTYNKLLPTARSLKTDNHPVPYHIEEQTQQRDGIAVESWSERRELNPYGRLGSPIPNRFTHYALRKP